MADGGDQNPVQNQAVIGMMALRLTCNPCSMKRSVKPISASIAGKHPTRAIRPVRGRGKTHDQVRRVGITEVRHWPPPVDLGGIGAALLQRDAFPPSDQTFTSATFR
jgi:hypothetical protein